MNNFPSVIVGFVIKEFHGTCVTAVSVALTGNTVQTVLNDLPNVLPLCTRDSMSSTQIKFLDGTHEAIHRSIVK